MKTFKSLRTYIRNIVSLLKIKLSNFKKRYVIDKCPSELDEIF